MESLRIAQGIAAPLLRANIDTDQIIPTRFLARLSEEGLGDGLFAEWAVRPDGSPDPGFLLNQAPWNRSTILVAGANFGCGSSREAAPRALRQRGFRALIAPSFGDIFFNNCFRNGIAPVRLPPGAVERIGGWLGAHASQPEQCRIEVDLDACTVRVPATGEVLPFTVPPLLRRMLLEGLDEIALTQTRQAEIDAFRRTDRASRPWAYLE